MIAAGGKSLVDKMAAGGDSAGASYAREFILLP